MLNKKIILALLFFVSLCHAADLHDPTRPSTYPESESEAANEMDNHSMILNEVLLSPSRRIAVINGIALQVGELENGIQLLSIDEQKQSVEVVKNKEKIELTFPDLNQANIEIKDKP